ncbi:MAG: ACP S-malonyltransferase [Pseudomonadota bacterium]
MKKLVYVFPGQSSLYPGMISKLVELHGPNGDMLAAASDCLHRDLAAHYRECNPDVFASNRDIQVGVFLANNMFLDILDHAGLSADLSLGLSLGEYNHLVHIGALPFQEALLTVEQRGLAYDSGPAGAMASVFPIDLEELEEIVERARGVGVLEIVNLNSPTQHVISGEQAAVEEALRILDAECFAGAVIIEKKIPMHCSTFEPVGDRFRVHLETVPFTTPRLPYFPNRLGRPLEEPSREDFVDLLSTHVHHPVLWRHSIDAIVERWPEAVFVEVGPRKVLFGLLQKKWHPVRKFHVDCPEETRSHLDGVIGELLGMFTEVSRRHVL